MQQCCLGIWYHMGDNTSSCAGANGDLGYVEDTETEVLFKAANFSAYSYLWFLSSLFLSLLIGYKDFPSSS